MNSTHNTDGNLPTSEDIQRQQRNTDGIHAEAPVFSAQNLVCEHTSEAKTVQRIHPSVHHTKRTPQCIMNCFMNDTRPHFRMLTYLSQNPFDICNWRLTCRNATHSLDPRTIWKWIWVHVLRCSPMGRRRSAAPLAYVLNAWYPTVSKFQQQSEIWTPTHLITNKRSYPWSSTQSKNPIPTLCELRQSNPTIFPRCADNIPTNSSDTRKVYGNTVDRLQLEIHRQKLLFNTARQQHEERIRSIETRILRIQELKRVHLDMLREPLCCYRAKLKYNKISKQIVNILSQYKKIKPQLDTLPVWKGKNYRCDMIHGINGRSCRKHFSSVKDRDEHQHICRKFTAPLYRRLPVKGDEDNTYYLHYVKSNSEWWITEKNRLGDRYGNLTVSTGCIHPLRIGGLFSPDDCWQYWNRGTPGGWVDDPKIKVVEVDPKYIPATFSTELGGSEEVTDSFFPRYIKLTGHVGPQDMHMGHIYERVYQKNPSTGRRAKVKKVPVPTKEVASDTHDTMRRDILTRTLLENALSVVVKYRGVLHMATLRGKMKDGYWKVLCDVDRHNNPRLMTTVPTTQIYRLHTANPSITVASILQYLEHIHPEYRAQNTHEKTFRSAILADTSLNV